MTSGLLEDCDSELSIMCPHGTSFPLSGKGMRSWGWFCDPQLRLMREATVQGAWLSLLTSWFVMMARTRLWATLEQSAGKDRAECSAGPALEFIFQQRILSPDVNATLPAPASLGHEGLRSLVLSGRALSAEYE